MRVRPALSSALHLNGIYQDHLACEASPHTPPSRHLIALRKAESSAESVRFVTLWKGRRGRKTLDGPHQQPAEPYAFPPATFTDPVHAVAPVARARQAMFAVLKRLGLEQAVDVALPTGRDRRDDLETGAKVSI